MTKTETTKSKGTFPHPSLFDTAPSSRVSSRTHIERVFGWETADGKAVTDNRQRRKAKTEHIYNKDRQRTSYLNGLMVPLSEL